MGLHYNDPALPKLVRPDAAEKVGVGAVLLQVRPLINDGSTVLEPIMCASAKFSDPATRWTTIEQECFAIYFAVLTFAYFLYGEVFTIETDPLDGIVQGTKDNALVCLFAIVPIYGSPHSWQAQLRG